MIGKDLIEDLIHRVADWPDDAKVELVESIVAIEEKHFGVYRLSDAERRDVQRGLDEMRRGKIASDEEVKALFDRYRG